MNDMSKYVRQYKHNDGSEGFVIGYEKDGIDLLVGKQQEEINELKAINELAQKTFQKIKDDNGCSVQMARSYMQFTRRMCLANVRADAENELIQAMIKIGLITSSDVRNINSAANKLREQAK